MQIDAVACRAARAILMWSQGRLAGEASVARGVVLAFEAGVSMPRRNNLAAIALAFEKAGCRFVVAKAGQIVVVPPVPPPAPMAVAAD
jgi:hypothetical protein